MISHTEKGRDVRSSPFSHLQVQKEHFGTRCGFVALYVGGTSPYSKIFEVSKCSNEKKLRSSQFHSSFLKKINCIQYGNPFTFSRDLAV